MKKMLLAGLMVCMAGGGVNAQTPPWPAPVAGYQAPAADEHPRLFFRKADLPAIKQRAQTPEGKAIVARLRKLLNGSDGETMPAAINPQKEDKEGMGEFGASAPIGAYTLWHGAGYGMLYQLTGDKKYADLGRQCIELALAGTHDRDGRYSFRQPHGALRAGPSFSAVAMAYDLCFDGWDPEFRQKVAKELLTFKDGAGESLAELARGSSLHPESNHWGPQIGGAGITLLAIMGDTGVDNAQVKALIDQNKAAIQKQLESTGDHGYFHEHMGPGQIMSDTAFVPALQAYRVAGGVDFVANCDAALWLALRWPMWVVPTAKGPQYPVSITKQDSYGTQVFDRGGLSRGGQYVQGMGIVPPQYQPLMLWSYQTVIQPSEGRIHGKKMLLQDGECSYDTVSFYPHRAVLALVNWPIGVKPANPATLLPKIMVDQRKQIYVFRNRWQDENDAVVALMFGARKDPGLRCRLWAGGQHFLGKLGWATKTGHFIRGTDGSVVFGAYGWGVTCDWSGASGAAALVASFGGAAFDWDLEPYDDAPVVADDKLDLNGGWAGGMTAKHEGNKITGTSTAKVFSGFEGTIEGRRVKMTFLPKRTYVEGTVSPSGNQIFWDNNTTWNRDGFQPKIPAVPVFKTGDKVRRQAVKLGKGEVVIITVADNGQHPEIKVDGETAQIGGQTLRLENGALVLGKMEPAK